MLCTFRMSAALQLHAAQPVGLARAEQGGPEAGVGLSYSCRTAHLSRPDTQNKADGVHQV